MSFHTPPLLVKFTEVGTSNDIYINANLVSVVRPIKRGTYIYTRDGSFVVQEPLDSVIKALTDHVE